MGFSITSPGLQQWEQTLSGADLSTIVLHAIQDVALDTIIPHLEITAGALGASQEMTADISLFQQGDSVVVGIPADSPASREAFDLEYGTAVGAPKGWLRTTIAHNKQAYSRQIGLALGAQLLCGGKR